MRYKIKVGSTGGESLGENGVVPAGYVLFVGNLGFDSATGLNAISGVPAIWDSGLNNIRPMTVPEIAALPAQKVLADHSALVAALSDQTNFYAKLLKAFVLTALDEINILRAAVPHPITSITRVTTTATVTTPTAHGKVAGDPISIMGADVASYNVTGTVLGVTNGTTFTYTMANSGATPATGSLFFSSGVVPQTASRTKAQLISAMTTKINAGDADS